MKKKMQAADGVERALMGGERSPGIPTGSPSRGKRQVR